MNKLMKFCKNTNIMCITRNVKVLGKGHIRTDQMDADLYSEADGSFYILEEMMLHQHIRLEIYAYGSIKYVRVKRKFLPNVLDYQKTYLRTAKTNKQVL
jgi:hypothetical protein